MIKFSPQIRKHIKKVNDGCIYVGLSRCKSFDHFFVPKCYRCYKFNHFAGESPDNDMPATCGRYVGRHKYKNCNLKSLEKCVICEQNRERNFKHNVFFSWMPAMVKVRAFVNRNTDLDGEKLNNRFNKEHFS